MRVAIIIPTWNRKENIVGTVQAVLMQVVEPHHKIDIIVVDDDSNDGTPEALAHLEQVRVLRHAPHLQWNASKPRNFGAMNTDKETDLLYFLDSDVLLPPDRVQRLIAVYERNPLPNRVIIGPYHFARNRIDVSDPDWYMKKQTDYDGDIRWKLFEKHEYPELNTGIQYALACFGGNLAIPRKLFFKTGGFDERMLSGVEDGDFGLTLWESGAEFSLDRGLLGWHNPHEIVGERTKYIKDCVKLLNEKHNIDIVHETGGVYRQWGIDWTPPDEWVEQSGYTREELNET